MNLLQPDWSRGLAELPADLGAVLVVIDTLARSMSVRMKTARAT